MRPKKVILLVNDDEQELSIHTFMLKTNGYAVLPAQDGEQAIRLFDLHVVDLVLVDYGMPGMNGSQLVSRLKRMRAHIPMILLGDPEVLFGQIHQADALLSKKQCSPQELLERIRIMSARKRGPRKATVHLENSHQVTA